jgi:hypothetical protein
MTMSIDETIQIVVDNDRDSLTSLAEFFNVQDPESFTEEDRREIRKALKTRGHYVEGAGGSAGFRLDRVREATAERMAFYLPLLDGRPTLGWPCKMRWNGYPVPLLTAGEVLDLIGRLGHDYKAYERRLPCRSLEPVATLYLRDEEGEPYQMDAVWFIGLDGGLDFAFPADGFTWDPPAYRGNL